MPTLDDVYRKYGEVSEAAQLLETELGTMLFKNSAIETDLIVNPNPEKATEIYNKINKHTLGQLINKLGKKETGISQLAILLDQALKVRNKLAHSFYLQHNLRRNSDQGCAVMLDDLNGMHDQLLDAYKAVMLLQGVDLEALATEEGAAPQPAGHLRI
tara:strand:- start:661 stop:1134 length:474 start_codon:yes stop_codon:yes gene_type:complete